MYFHSRDVVTVYFHSAGVVIYEFAPHDHHIMGDTKEYYLEIMRRLRDAVAREQPDLWTDGKLVVLSQRTCPHFRI